MFGPERGHEPVVPGALPGCVADAFGAWSKAAGADLSLLDERGLYELASTAAAHRSMVQTVEALALAELDRQGTVARDHAVSAARWHAAQTNTSTRDATAAIKVGDLLAGRFGKVRDALAAGEVSFAHARQLEHVTKPEIADGLAAQQDRLLANAKAGTFDQWSEDLRHRASRLHAESEHDPQTDPASNRVRFCRRSNGLLGFDANLTDEHGVSFQHLVEAEADRLFRAAAKAHTRDPSVPIPKREQLQAEALVALTRRGAGMDLESTRGPQTEAILIIRAEDTDLQHVTTPDGSYVHPVVAGMHACDALWHAIVINDKGRPLWVGRASRDATPAQRLALIIRDGGCVMPGCHAPPSWCDAHHVIWWERGGRTDIGNLALLCRSCHGKIHSGRFKLQADGNGGFSVTYPDGHTEPTQHQPPPHGHEP